MSWQIQIPQLSRGLVERWETLPAEQMVATWSDSLVLGVGPGGTVPAVEVAGVTRADWQPATGEPPPGAVHLGVAGGRTRWAVPVEDAGSLTLRELGALVGDDDAALMVAAVALIGWHRAAPFCPACGEASSPDPTGRFRTCPQQHQEFPRTDPAVIVLVNDGAEHLVLARQEKWPAGRHSVLAGFCEAGESLEATVHRELAEEVGLQVTDVRYLGSQPWPFPRSLMVGFEARVPVGAELTPNPGEIAEARWVSRSDVRALLAGEPPADADAAEISLPGSISIARRMIEAWAAAG